MKFFTNLTVGFFNFLTFKNILLVVVIVIALSYILPQLKSSSLNENIFKNSFSGSMIKADFFEAVRIKAKNKDFFENYATDQRGLDTCILGDETRDIPSCSDRNRCFAMDEIRARRCEDNCIKNCK